MNVLAYSDIDAEAFLKAVYGAKNGAVRSAIAKDLAKVLAVYVSAVLNLDIIELNSGILDTVVVAAISYSDAKRMAVNSITMDEI